MMYHIIVWMVLNHRDVNINHFWWCPWTQGAKLVKVSKKPFMIELTILSFCFHFVVVRILKRLLTYFTYWVWCSNRTRILLDCGVIFTTSLLCFIWYNSAFIISQKIGQVLSFIFVQCTPFSNIQLSVTLTWLEVQQDNKRTIRLFFLSSII